MVDTAAVRLVDPRTDALWTALAARSDASLFTSPAWIDAVCATYGFTPCAAVATNSAGIADGGFAWVEIDDLRGPRAVSLPFGDRAEPFRAPGVSIADLAAPAVRADAPLSVRCLQDSAALFETSFAPVGGAAWHATVLPGGLDEFLRSVRSTARRNLARADRVGVKVQVRADLDALRRLHELHVELRRRRYRLLAQPWTFFEAIWERFAPGGHAVVLLAEHDDTVVAAALLLAWNDVVYYKFGASSLQHLQHRPNDAIFRAALAWAVERRARLLDWGISDDDQPGLIRFKDKWANLTSRVVTLRAGGQAMPACSDSGPLLRELTALLTDDSVPPDITTRAGALLYRYFA